MALITTNLNNISPEDLVSLLVGTGVTVSNIKVTPGVGDGNLAIGSFSGGFGDDIGIDSGVILNTGDISDISGPNDADNTVFAGLGTPGDIDLNVILDPTSTGQDEEGNPEGSTNDAVVLEFDFVPDNEEFVFEYVFGSDEYNEFANSIYNDIFAFLLDGENIALIPGTSIPVSINNINATENTNYYRNNDLDDVAPEDLLNTEFDGLTTVLGVRGFVTPGKTHHLKLAIADVGDATYHSAVFLKAGSLSTPPATADATLTFNDREIVTINSPVSPAYAKLRFTLSGTDTDSINEVGVFTVDDDFGTIDGVAPGSEDYEQLALARITSRSIFTGLAGSLMDGQNLTRLINYDVGSKLGFYLITDGTADTMLSDSPLYFHNPTPNILYSFPEANPNFQDPLKITANNNVLTLSWEDDSGDNDYNDLVLTVEVTDPDTIPVSALSSRRQGDVQKEIIDLSILEDGATINADISIWSESAFDNRVGLYRLENAQGTVLDQDTGETFTPDQQGYLAAAIRQRVFEFDSKGGGSIELEKGFYAPYIIVNGTAEQWLNSNAGPSSNPNSFYPPNFYTLDTFAYVPFINADNAAQTNYDRITLLADNTFAFEDQLINDSDYDYNDMVLKVDFPENTNNSTVFGEAIAISATENSDTLNTPINRFQNSELPGTYLYAGEAESQNIRANFPNLIEEGQAFKVAVEPGDNLIRLNRFQNSDLPGTYLYAGEAESQNIRVNFPNFIEEGIAFYVYDGAANLGVDVYRFQNQDLPGTYIFVTGEERQNILANFPNFVEEGVAFEVEI